MISSCIEAAFTVSTYKKKMVQLININIFHLKKKSKIYQIALINKVFIIFT